MYNYLGSALVTSQAHKTPEVMTYHQYINILENSIIDDKTGESPEYRDLIKYDEHKRYG